MPEPQYRQLTATVTENVLVLTMTMAELQDERVADALLQELLDVLDQFGVYKVALDMARIKFLSSVAFRPLLRLRTRLRETGGSMILCGLTSTVGDIFYTT